MWTCKHCVKDYDFITTSEKANHSRWCNDNPKRNDTKNLKSAIHKSIDVRLGILVDYEMDCATCGNTFIISERSKQFPKKEFYFCSRSCANHRGTGIEWAKLRNSDLIHYTTICFAHNERKCIICGFDKIVAVHHIDYNHENNNPLNLIPLCPNHHEMVHSNKWKNEIQQLIDIHIMKIN